MNGLTYIRKRCGISIIELANAINVSRQAVSSWENGRRPLPEARAQQLSDFFGIGKEYFGKIDEKQKEADRKSVV